MRPIVTIVNLRYDDLENNIRVTTNCYNDNSRNGS